jgi:hypothetical protein
MPIQRLSPEPAAFLKSLEDAVANLYYPSETEKPFKVSHFTQEQVGERFSTTDLQKLFYPDQAPDEPIDAEWALLERVDTNGYHNFFKHYADKITQFPHGEIVYWEPAFREQAAKWRVLRDLILGNLIHQRWFKVNFSGSARKDIFVVGQLVQIDFNTDTNEITPLPIDWFVLATGAVES